MDWLNEELDIYEPKHTWQYELFNLIFSSLQIHYNYTQHKYATEHPFH